MKISKSIILPEWESIEDLNQASNILKQITEAMKDHQIQNYEDTVASFRQITTGRIQSHDGKTYFDLDSGVIRGNIIFRPGTSGFANVEDASPNDWDNAFKLANAIKGDSDFTLISGGKIITNSIAVGTFNSDVIGRMFGSGASKEAIEAWMKAGHITYIDGNKIYAGSITLSGGGGAAADFNWSHLYDDGNKPDNNADVTSTSNFVTVTYPEDQTDLQTQIDGKIISWFTDTDPSGTWEGTDASHAGDMWWNTSTKKLKRYDGSLWSTDIEDQKAIDAYVDAATAQDTADGKRRVFTAEPTTPYNVGDLWSDGTDLKKCKTERLTGAYVAGDWELATNYDHTADIVSAMAYESLVEYAKLGTTVIQGGYIKTSLLNVDYSIIVGTKPPANADYFGGSAGALAYLSSVGTAQLGTTVIQGGYLRTDLIKVKKIYVGGGTNEDIYFEDSGIRLYDVGDVSMKFYKSAAYNSFIIALRDGYTAFITGATHFDFGTGGRHFNVWDSGALQLPSLTSDPTTRLVNGQIAWVNGVLRIYNDGWSNV